MNAVGWMLHTILVDVASRCVKRNDCQTELRTSTSTYFSTCCAAQSTGPFFPFFPFLPPPFFFGISV